MILDKHEKGVDVRLITTTSYKNKSHLNSLLDLIEQKTIDNNIEQKIFSIIKQNKKTIFAIILFMLLLLIFTDNFIIRILLLFCGLGMILYFKFSKKISNKYFYKAKIKLKICKTQYADHNRNDFIHSKIFIIDDICAIGSVNLTDAGMFKNYETLVIFKSKKILEKIKGEFNLVWSNPLLDEKNIQEVGDLYFKK